MNVYTITEYARHVCCGKVTRQTVHNWVKSWKEKGNLPPGHSLKHLPNKRVLIEVSDPTVTSREDELVNFLVERAS